MGVGGNDIGPVLNRADIPEKHTRAGDRADRCTQKFSKVTTQRGISPRDTLQLASPHISGGHHQSGFAHCGDRLVGGNLVLLEFVGIECDDDRSLISSEWWRSRYARQGCEKRPYTVQCEILQLALRMCR